MAVTSIDANNPASGNSAETEFDAAVEGSEGLTDEEFTQQLVTGAVQVGGQMIIMPRANDILNEAMSDE